MKAPETPRQAGKAEEAAFGVPRLGKQRPGACPGTLTGRGQLGGRRLLILQGASLRGQDPPSGISCSATVGPVQPWVRRVASQNLSFLIRKMGVTAALSFEAGVGVQASEATPHLLLTTWRERWRVGGGAAVAQTP